jgi:hypothetical protein
MKNKLFVFILLILYLVFIHAQLLSQVLTERFDWNTLHWPTQDDEYAKIEFKDGFYTIEHKIDESGYTIYRPIGIDYNRDLTIETVIEHVSGRDDAGYGLLLDMVDGNNYYAFDIAANGYYRIAQCINNEWTDLTPWTQCDHIKTGNLFNTLLVRKHGNEYYFVINNKIIDMHELELLGGEEVGFSVYLKQKISIDKLDIEYVDPDLNIDKLEKFKELNQPNATEDFLNALEELGF